MPAFVVKHLVAANGPLMTNIKEISITPYSYTSKYAEAMAAARGNFVYVIEVLRVRGEITYLLGYKYRAFEAYMRAGGALWKGEFAYKNSATPGTHAEGAYFDTPVAIEDLELCQWLRAIPPGMTEIPLPLPEVLDLLLVDPAKGARTFA